MGQLPSSAFPLCGIGHFRQLILPYGSGGNLNIAGCGSVNIINPYYYSFTCYSGGTLSLLIDPLDSQQDYNWELFDISGHDPNEIFTDPSLAIIGNWSGRYGKTGARAGGAPTTVCVTPPQSNDSTFSEEPDLVTGHQYLLLISGYSKIQSDYFLSFEGSSSIISNPVSPQIKIINVTCNKRFINIVTSKKMTCNSLASDGSNFTMNSGTVSIIAAQGVHCGEQFDFDSIQIILSDTLAPGTYSISTKTNNQGNSIFDDCFNPVPPEQVISFTVYPTGSVSADFNFHVSYGCQYDTAYFNPAFAGGQNLSRWFIDSVFNPSLPDPIILKPTFKPVVLQHIVSNGICYDTVTKTINTDNQLQAGFQAKNTFCPRDLVDFHDNSNGNIISWTWNFDDGTTGTGQNPPPHLFPETPGEKKYSVQLIVENNQGCYDTFSTGIIKLTSCYIAVPNVFTPNADGKNDYLYPLNAFSARDLEFIVYNRFGQPVFESRDPNHKWDGTINGAAQPTDTYIWTLRYKDGLSGKQVFLQGTSVLIR
jgi:gliding motility-associated-like protein